MSERKDYYSSCSSHLDCLSQHFLQRALDVGHELQSNNRKYVFDYYVMTVTTRRLSANDQRHFVCTAIHRETRVAPYQPLLGLHVDVTCVEHGELGRENKRMISNRSKATLLGKCLGNAKCCLNTHSHTTAYLNLIAPAILLLNAVVLKWKKETGLNVTVTGRDMRFPPVQQHSHTDLTHTDIKHKTRKSHTNHTNHIDHTIHMLLFPPPPAGWSTSRS